MSEADDPVVKVEVVSKGGTLLIDVEPDIVVPEETEAAYEVVDVD